MWCILDVKISGELVMFFYHIVLYISDHSSFWIDRQLGDHDENTMGEDEFGGVLFKRNND